MLVLRSFIIFGMALVLEPTALSRFHVTDEILYKGLVEMYELEELD